jgi:hypothetical protein
MGSMVLEGVPAFPRSHALSHPLSFYVLVFSLYGAEAWMGIGCVVVEGMRLEEESIQSHVGMAIMYS